MKDVLFVLALIAAAVCGYFLMKKLDRFLSGNRKAIEKESEAKAPSCVMLDPALTEDEIAEEVRRFRQTHAHVTVYLYDSEQESEEKQ